MTDLTLVPWRSRAACHETTVVNPGMDAAWITEAGPRLLAAKAICRSCPVRMKCLSEALNDPSSFGLRGGYFFNNGALTRADAERMAEELGIRAKVRQKTRKDARETVSL